MASSARRALSNVGGRIQVDLGNEWDRKLLNFALDVRADDRAVRGHVHGFHAYPARLHPVTAQRLIKGLTRPGDGVLDPFCGSGTVLVEALLEGRIPAGLDANPLAVMLASFKLRKSSAHDRELLLGSARVVAEAAEARRMARLGPSRRYPGEQARQFDPHVLLELDGLRQGIDKIDAPRTKEGLSLVLSSIANKVSRQASDTTSRESQRRWASGFVIQFFVRKTEELTKRQAQYASRLGEGETARACVKHGDAQQLPFESDSFRAIVTSPPYPGVYDYVEHHRLRLQWLGLNTEYLWKHEIGARRHAGAAQSLRETFNAQLQRCLSEMARVVVRGGTVALIVADSVVDGSAWYADAEIEPLAGRAGLTLAAAAAQTRPHFHGSTAKAFGRRPRSERVLFLRRK